MWLISGHESHAFVLQSEPFDLWVVDRGTSWLVDDQVGDVRLLELNDRLSSRRGRLFLWRDWALVFRVAAGQSLALGRGGLWFGGNHSFVCLLGHSGR